MRLTLYTDYALRVLMQVAITEGGLTTINDIAKTFNVSKQHLMKVVHQLGRKGYLDTVQGRGGGIRLRRPAGDIVVGQVVRDMEARLDFAACDCACELRDMFDGATQAFLRVLDKYTVADLIKPQQPIRSLLLLDSAANSGWQRVESKDAAS